MATANPYFLYPWCTSGSGSDITAIPNTGTEADPVNYQYGFTPPYELPSSDPSNLPVPRQQFNQLMFDITSALQQLQNYGVPNWVAPGSGGPANYSINAFVLYTDGNVYVSAINTNTSVPGADANWILFNPAPNPIVAGTILDFAGISAPTGYLLCNNQQVSRSTYATLFAAITYTQSCVESASVNITVADSSNMFVGMKLEGTNIPTNTTVASIIDSTHITISNVATGSGTFTLRFFPWGNGDGSTTFNTPSLNGRVTMGSKAGVISGTNGIGQNPGQLGGGNSYTMQLSDMVDHTHTTGVQSYKQATGTTKLLNGPGAGGLLTINFTSSGMNGYTTQTAMPTIQAAAIVTKIIKT